MVRTSLYKMTKELAREYHREFQSAPDIFMDMGQLSTYVYNAKVSDTVRTPNPLETGVSCGHAGDVVTGEIILKENDRANHHCYLEHLSKE